MSIETFFEELWDKVTDAADTVYDAVVSLFKKGASSTADVLKTFATYFADHIDDILIAAAKEGVNAAKTADGEWTDKLLSAVTSTIDELGDKVGDYSKTDIINAVQSVYTGTKVSA